jgi:hypothetical protein
MRLHGAAAVGLWPGPRRRRRRLQAAEPAQQGTLAGQGLAGVGGAEADADVAGAPEGMQLPQGQGLRAERAGSPEGPAGAGAVGGPQGVGMLTEAAQQVLGGAQGQAQAVGQLGDGQVLLGEPPQAPPQGEGDGSRHDDPRSETQWSAATIDPSHTDAKPFWRD